VVTYNICDAFTHPYNILFFLMCSSNDNDLEDGEIPSDEDDEPVIRAANDAPEIVKPTPKPDTAKNKNFDAKFKNKKSQGSQAAGKHDRFLKYKGPTEDWAGDVEKAIKAAMEEDGKSQESKAKNKNNRNKARKRARDEREEERNKDQKVYKIYNDRFHLYRSIKHLFSVLSMLLKTIERINYLCFMTKFL